MSVFFCHLYIFIWKVKNIETANNEGEVSDAVIIFPIPGLLFLSSLSFANTSYNPLFGQDKIYKKIGNLNQKFKFTRHARWKFTIYFELLGLGWRSLLKIFSCLPLLPIIAHAMRTYLFIITSVSPPISDNLFVNLCVQPLIRNLF